MYAGKITHSSPFHSYSPPSRLTFSLAACTKASHEPACILSQPSHVQKLSFAVVMQSAQHSTTQLFTQKDPTLPRIQVAAQDDACAGFTLSRLLGWIERVKGLPSSMKLHELFRVLHTKWCGAFGYEGKVYPVVSYHPIHP